MKSQKTNIKRGIANAFGSFGYFFSFFAWFWALMLYFSVFKATIILVAPNADTPVIEPPQVTAALPGWLEVTIVVVVTIIMLAVTAYALAKLPSKIAKVSGDVVHKTANAAVPLVIRTQHKNDTKKIRAKLTPRLLIAVKALIIIIPLIASLASKLFVTQLIDYTIAVTIAYGLAGVCVLFFALQYIVANALHVKPVDLR